MNPSFVVKEACVCPLCGHNGSIVYEDKARPYQRCARCHLMFVPPAYFLSLSDEKKRYDFHQNSADQEGYVHFLNRLLVAMQSHLSPESKGLDFGSGPQPILAGLFKQAGYGMDVYDVFYADDPGVFERPYDFITMSEVAEHLRDPRKELDRLWALLKPGGWLGIMTQLTNNQDLRQWYYLRDQTHVCFFARETFEWLAKEWRARVTYCGHDIVLLQKIT